MERDIAQGRGGRELNPTHSQFPSVITLLHYAHYTTRNELQSSLDSLNLIRNKSIMTHREKKTVRLELLRTEHERDMFEL